MDAFKAIFSRHTNPIVRPDPVPRELVEKILSAGAQAPNHHRFRPWRFIVLEGTARHRLGDVLAAVLQARQPEVTPAALEKERAKPLRAPLIIAIAVDLPDDPRGDLEENICAASAAAENMLLAVQALGLGAIWRTGAPTRSAQVKSFLGLKPEQPLIAFLYIGYRDQELPETERPSFEDRTTWMES
jgi:nitroreductase